MVDSVYSFLAETLQTETRQLLVYAVIFVLLERLWPASPDQPRWRRDSKLDLAFGYLVPLIALPFYYLILTFVIKVLRGPATSGALLEIYRFTSSQSSWLQILAAVFIADFVGYWKHRWFHSRYLWPFHAIHHSSQQVDWLSNERFHPVNALVGSLLQTLALLILGFGPDTIALTIIVRRSYSIFEHSNLQLSFGVFDYIFVNPLFHRWHHSDDERAIDKNYANIFSLFDLVFGTYYFPRKEDPASFGLVRARIEGGFVAHLIYPMKQLFNAGARRGSPP